MEKVCEELEEANAEIDRLRCKVDDKESTIKQMSDTLRADCNEKVKKLEEENRQLLVYLDEASEKEREKQVKLNALTDEAESLKALVSVLQMKCSESEKEAKSPKDKMWQGDDMLQELEDRRKKAEDELKWKVEQFKHLEEAHEKLRDEFRVSKNEWEMEKSSLLDEISKLQESVDEGQRTAEGLRNQFDNCKQALEHEKSRRKGLEVQVSEMKSLLENASNEGLEGGKTEMECSTAQRGEDEVATLRHSLRVKEMEYKDMEYKANKLEIQNRELLTSIKELQEAHIPKAATPPQSSWVKLRSKLKSLEQTHKDCSVNLKAKEAEWSSQAQKMTQELHRCSSSLKVKDQVIDELKNELEEYNSSLTQLKMQNEELSLMLQLMRSDISEVGSDQQGKDKESGVGHLTEQLEMKNSSLAKAKLDLEKERDEKLAMQKELEKLKDMLEESSKCQLSLIEQSADTEQKLKEELEEVHDALERVDSELTDKTNVGSELEYELQIWKSIAERLKKQVEESQAMRRELEASLLAQVEVEEMLKQETDEKDQRIRNLEQQIILFDQEILIREGDTTEDIEKPSQRLQIDNDEQEQDLLARELEEAILSHIRKERNYTQHVGNLQQIEVSLDQSFQDDMGPAGMLGRTVQDEKTRIYLEGEEVCSAKENVNGHHGALSKTGELIIEERSPFRELN